MSQASVRAPSTPPVRLIFDGQSHNIVPFPPILGQPYPWHLTRGRGVPWGVVAVSGSSWTVLLTDIDERLYPTLGHATTTVLLMSGGSSDVVDGDTGAQIYTDHVTYADLARTADPTIKIIACTLLGSTGFAIDSREARRLDFNTLLLADADDAFDAIADVDAAFVAIYGAAYWSNTSVLWDGLHMTNAAAVVYADTVAPVLDSLI